MKKFFSLVLALVMALSLTTVAWGADPVPVTSTADLQAAINRGDTKIVLGEGEFTADFYDGTPNRNLTITGQGAATKLNFANLQVRLALFDSLTIENCTIGRMLGKSWGQLVFGSSTQAGGVYTISNCIFDDEGTQGIYINQDVAATFNIVNCTFKGDFGDEGAIVVQNNSVPAIVNVSDNNFSVTKGEKIAIHYHKDQLILNADVEETVLIKAGPDAETAEENFAKAVATAEAGDTFKLMADVTLAAPIAITTPITIVENGHDLLGMPAGVTDGTNVTTDASGKLTGGTFAAAPDADDVADGYSVLKNTDGTYIVVLTQTFGDKYDLYLANVGMQTALKNKTPSVAALSFEEVGALKNLDGSGRVAYIAANNGQFFVKTTNPTVADYAVTYAGKTDVLYYVYVGGTSAANFYYDEEVKAFNSWGLKCGQYNNTGWTTAQKAEDYFMASNQVIYMADDAGVSGNYLLDGVVVSGVALDMTKYVDHHFVASNFKYDAATGANVPTSALCTTCTMNTSAIYKIGKAPANSIVKPLYVNGAVSDVWEVVVGSAAPTGGAVVTPSTDKVTSAETFDAGIAMYVGMSVMAAAGSVVVLKKRED